MKYVLAIQFITLIFSYAYYKHEQVNWLRFCTFGSSISCVIVAFFSCINQSYTPNTSYISLYNFIVLKNVNLDIGILSDSLSLLVALSVCIITTIANFYSIGYIKKEFPKFIFQLNVFAFCMTCFISAGNLLQMYIFWEFLSLSAYFLIIFQKQKEAIDGAIKTISLHKLSDLMFLVALVALLQISGTLDFDEITGMHSWNDYKLHQMEIIALIMLVSIFVKTAQFMFYGWLENAAYAPTPASALIHSITIVPAGIFIIIRLQSLFECSELVQNIMIFVGLATAILSCIVAVFSTNIKKTFAHSTCSQIGLMLAACGFSAYGAAVILCIMHAFSKSLLFFSTGSVMHSLSGEQNIEKMGGLFELLPKTYISFVAAAVCMVGIPLLPYYYAKKVFINEVLCSNLMFSNLIIVVLIIVSILTSTYLFRTIYLVFHEKIKLDETCLAYINEDNRFIINSLYASIFFTVFSGGLFYYGYYTNIIWKDMFSFLNIAHESSIFLYSMISIVGAIIAFTTCKHIKPIQLSYNINCSPNIWPMYKCYRKLSKKFRLETFDCVLQKELLFCHRDLFLIFLFMSFLCVVFMN